MFFEYRHRANVSLLPLCWVVSWGVTDNDAKMWLDDHYDKIMTRDVALAVTVALVTYFMTRYFQQVSSITQKWINVSYVLSSPPVSWLLTPLPQPLIRNSTLGFPLWDRLSAVWLLLLFPWYVQHGRTLDKPFVKDLWLGWRFSRMRS